MDLPSLRRDALAFQLVSPVRADAVFAARALVGERGAHAAEAVHRALEEFAPGGIVRDAGDLLACIELRALADEHYGPWIVPDYAAQVVMRPVILHVQLSRRGWRPATSRSAFETSCTSKPGLDVARRRLVVRWSSGWERRRRITMRTMPVAGRSCWRCTRRGRGWRR